ncbi:G-protein coupled receptor 4-like [Lepisosteus oculatus]|uniref:G-protein coupled receptor 4-like n=1 Tax=Lepisosteus oculatus TaxID=7918 RepID=UPI003721915C
MNTSPILNYTEIINNIDSSDFILFAHSLTSLRVIMGYVVICISLPANCLAIYGLYHLIKSDHVIPVYIINLLISDLLQLPSNLASNIYVKFDFHLYTDVFVRVLLSIFFLGVSGNIGFMVCIALERYLVIVHPLWYRLHRSIRITVLVSLVVWALCIFCTIIISYTEVYAIYLTGHILWIVILAVSLFLLVFSYISTRRAIARAIAVPDVEKRKILHVLTLVLTTYIVLFLPYLLFHFLFFSGVLKTLYTPENANVFAVCLTVASLLITLNPVVDPVLYFLLRTKVRGTLGSSHWRQRVIRLVSLWGRPVVEPGEEAAAAAETGVPAPSIAISRI